jgi:hypothetical protein
MNRREALEAALDILAPRIPDHEFEAVLDHALTSRGLGTAAPETAIWLSLVAYIRHRFTDYDSLMDEGYDGESARFFVADEINGKLAEWGSPRRLDDRDAAPE